MGSNRADRIRSNEQCNYNGEAAENYLQVVHETLRAVPLSERERKGVKHVRNVETMFAAAMAWGMKTIYSRYSEARVTSRRECGQTVGLAVHPIHCDQNNCLYFSTHVNTVTYIL